MPADVSISFVGAGNVAWHLAPALDNAGYVVREVYSRSRQRAEALTSRLYQGEVKASLDFSTSISRLFILAVPDDALESVCREIILPEEACLIHTSGSAPLEVLRFAAAAQVAVLYPLQTFSQGKPVDFREIPIFIETEDEEAWEQLKPLARSLSRQVQRVSGQDRLALHVAAVFAANFTNYLLGISQQILEEQNLPFGLMRPLVAEVMEKIFLLGPRQAQTGPARRGDLQTLDRHLEFLAHTPQVVDVYRLLSQQILDRYAAGDEG